MPPEYCLATLSAASEREALEEFVGQGAGALLVDAVEVGDQPEIFSTSQQLIDSCRLGGQAHAAAYGGRLLDDVMPGDAAGS